MKKIISLAVLSLAMLPAAAQDTYENARLLGSDLNGTARYVGMGGALDALGADISTIGTNPAGIGITPIAYISCTSFSSAEGGTKERPTPCGRRSACFALMLSRLPACSCL